MDKVVFKYIESELYNYHDTVEQIDSIRANILMQSEFSENPDENIGAGRSNTTISTTELAAVKLVTDKRLERLERVKGAIESVAGNCDQNHRELIRLKYWTKPQPLNWTGIAMRLNISKATAHRYRGAIINAIGEKLGY